ncbi:hypothetical protein [Anaeroselena agilis]|uniref:GIY-YIG domain-containing protein n=1 Tax=Anaeroselena agilis TaxID=3063788 RepID=A0ABU3NXU2_9FIRM|nr:hypothetical protein [Selenomonadales bacterium 4137-cl]
MPFIQQNPKIYNKVQVEYLYPNQYGVYGIFKQRVWIYIGKGDIRQRLLDHLNGDNPSILYQNPTHWVAEVTPYADEREKQLILEYRPICNKKVG